MGGFNDKKQANVKKFIQRKSGFTSPKSMVEYLSEKKILLDFVSLMNLKNFWPQSAHLVDRYD